jgi:uncharacterized protein (DUF1501 family)
MKITRRQFLRRGAGTAAALGLAPSVLVRGAAAAPVPDRYLVVVQLYGGNDGINTLVPAGIPSAGTLYYDRRPTLAVGSPHAINGTTEYGLHPAMTDLANLYNGPSQPLAIVQGVGYPNQSRSHFLSQDIWGSADPVAVGPTGWLGRYLDWRYADGTPDIHGVEIHSYVERLFHAPNVNVLTGRSADQFGIPSDDRNPSERDSQVQAVRDLFSIPRSGEAGFVQAAGHAVNQNLDDFAAIETEPPAYVSMGSYDQGQRLHRSLQFAAQTILHRDAGGQALIPRVLHLGIGGFDNHSKQDQDGKHSSLLEQVSTGLTAFYDDMVGHGMGDAVTVLTISEFGRTTDENGSHGTDHGAASLLFLLGDAVQGGLHGAYPSLEDADLDEQGDLVFQVDFRSVYATILADWFAVPTLDIDVIFGGSVPLLPGLFKPGT